MKVMLNGKEVDFVGPKETFSAGDGVELSKEGTTTTIDLKLPTKALTEVEYAGLTDEEKQSDIVYVITDGKEGPVAPRAKVEYSLDEQVIGTWIDGKPLYKKTFQISTPNTAGTEQTVGTIPIENQVVYFSGCMINNGSIAPFPLPYSNASGYLYIDNGNIITYVGSTGHTSKPIILTLEYTKTTD